MKKLLLVLFFVLVIIPLIGAGIFLMTFDVDRFRPQIVSQIEKALQKPVRLEKIKLAWQSGIALELQGFSILKSEQSSENLAEIQSAKAVLTLAPLLKRQIQIATVYLNAPVIRLARKPDGTFDGWEPAPAQPGGQASAASPQGDASALSFLVNKIRIQNGELFFKDATGKDPMEVHLRKIMVEIDDVALDQPIDFNAQAAVLGREQNLDVKGKLAISSKDFTAVLSGFHAGLQLMPLEVLELIKVSPAIATSGILFPLEGTLSVDVDFLKLDPKGLQELAAKVRLERGKVRLTSLQGPIENISAEALVTAAMIKVQRVAADIAGGNVEGLGAANITDPRRPAISFDIKAERLRIEALVPAPQAGPQLRGALTLTARGNVAGQTPEEMKRTLSAEGVATLEQGVITDMNILREVFQKISVIPGLMERLLARLPQDYKSRLDEKDTKLKTIQLPFSVRNGTVDLPRLNVAADFFHVEGSGTYGLDQGTVMGAALLSIDKDLSAAMIRSVEELQYLASEKGELQVPLSFRGNVPQVAVLPDIQSVAVKIAGQKARDMLGGYLEKAIGGKEAKQNTGTSPEPVTGRGILGEILRQAAGGTAAE